LGPDDDEVDAERDGEPGHRGTVEGVHGVQLRERSDARVAGRGEQLVAAVGVVERECSDDRVLAGAGSDDEDLHGVEPTEGSSTIHAASAAARPSETTAPATSTSSVPTTERRATTRTGASSTSPTSAK